jgi:hypothetical protein
VGIPNVKCNTQEQATSKLRGAGFEVDVASQKVASDCPPGTVAGTDPSGSGREGSVVCAEHLRRPGRGRRRPARGGGGGGGPGNNDRCKKLPMLCPPPRR